jgi:hypothetical protein
VKMVFLIAAALPLLLMLPTSLCTQNLNVVELGLIELEFIRMRVAAVEIDMRLFYEMQADSVHYEKEEALLIPKDAVFVLSGINRDLRVLSLPPELDEMKQQYIQIIDKIASIYAGFAQESIANPKEEYEEYWKMIEDYDANLTSVRESYFKEPAELKGFDSISYEAIAIANRKDRASFIKADSLFAKEGAYREARDILRDILPRYKGTDAEGSILCRFVQCAMSDKDEDVDECEAYLKLLDDYIAEGKYSPQSYMIYLQWRTLKQVCENGRSNWSHIPNAYYISVLHAQIKAVEGHIEIYPDDPWARVQLQLLMNEPCIERWGGFKYGNNVSIHEYTLWYHESVKKGLEKK